MVWVIGGLGLLIVLLAVPLAMRRHRRGELFGRRTWRHGDEKRPRIGEQGIPHGSEGARIAPSDQGPSGFSGGS